MLKKSWYELTKMFNAVPYKLGSRNIDEGLDCLSVMFRFMENFGFDISKWNNDEYFFNYKGKKINRNNYQTELKDGDEQRGALREFIRSELIKVNELRKGCICITKVLKFYCVSIYLGRGHFLTVTEEKGARIIKQPISNILEIYKWRYI